MALTAVNQTMMQTKVRLVVNSTLVVDGTPGTDVILVDKSTFTGPNGSEPGRLVVERIEWSLDGLNATLEFDHAADNQIAALGGQGFMDFTGEEGYAYQGFVDPKSADGTGDIVVTSLGDTAGDVGSITLYLRKKD